MANRGKISCPNCGSNNITFNPWLGQIWTCQHCGYRGPVELTEDGEPSEKDKKLLEEIKEEIKNEKPSAKGDGRYKKYLVMVLAVVISILLVGTYGLILGFILLLYSIGDLSKK